MKKILLLLAFAIILTSCSTIGNRMSGINPGMTKPEVISILGKPWTTGGRSSVEVLHYKDDGYYFVRLVDGKVESYGPETRQNPVTDSNPPLKK